MVKLLKISVLFFLIFVSNSLSAQTNNFKVIAYYSGGPEKVENFEIEKLTHIIFSFSHLRGNRLTIDNARDEATIRKLVDSKKRNPQLKVILSLGGWGGCKTCSDVFSTSEDRQVFAESVGELLKKFGADGIDLDWEYPAIEGYPGHAFNPADKNNFTQLIIQLRKELGEKPEISFAAGGFENFLDSSIDWTMVMPLVNNINLMSYDLVNGYSAETGHHTPLYSTPQQEKLSVNWGVTQLMKRGVPKEKIVIGAAFYGRIWENVAEPDSGLYGKGKFKKSESIKQIDELLKDKSYTYYWDDVAKAPYIYNAAQKLFITYDDKKSIEYKTKYVADKQLGGIMFWELSLDYYENGLLDQIDKVKKSYLSK